MKPIQMAIALLTLTSAVEFSDPKSAAAKIDELGRQPTLARQQFSSVPASEKLLEQAIKKQEQEDYRAAIAEDQLGR